MPRRASLTAEEICTEFESVLSRMGIRGKAHGNGSAWECDGNKSD